MVAYDPAVLAITFYDTVLWVHILAVVVAFGAIFAYPVFLGVNAKEPLAQRGALHRQQIAFSKKVTGPVIGVVLLAGIYLAADRDYFSKVWVTVPLILLFVVAGLGSTVLRQAEVGMLAASESGDEPGYATALAAAKQWTLAIIALVVVAMFFMAVKPGGY